VSFGSVSLSTASPFVVSYDTNGNEQWIKATTRVDNIEMNASGEIYLSGSFATSINLGTCASCILTASPSSNSNIFLAKLDPSGNAIWARTALSDGNDEITDIALDPAGNVYATGNFT